ncbi:MAG: hypothetical protein ABI222_16555, partial [Opitutaceae bacterium]
MISFEVALMLASHPIEAAPPAFEFSLSAGGSGSSHIREPAQSGGQLTTSQAAVNLLGRQILGSPSWYFCYGLQVEQYQFRGSAVWPERLQDLAVPLRVEYLQGGQTVAQLTLQPGYYFGRTFSPQAWDVPVELISGVPLSTDLHGVLGIDYGRFYHHPLPIVGLVWEFSHDWRMEMIYPEPALVYTPGLGRQWRLGGELTGGGFLLDGHVERSIVEYSSYGVGISYSCVTRNGPGLMVGAGIQTGSTADFFRLDRRLNAG